jgi:hypothetical protein
MKKLMLVLAGSLLVGNIGYAAAGKLSQRTNVPVTIAGMGTSTDKQYALDLRRCAAMTGADKASCISFAKQRHGEI